ncbi:hypothetical protein STAFG_4066 [Streptomyces afghaniensis 772]|uniref:Uncharacterized protein n=1 Tax=Streptomyces afghaniensis 772 TaxID=1283301 RepID=S4NKL0_9ACTN|nr:hypothetical protein STAFG_4066 [Streptomyces afghaniensis 772]
MAVDRRRSMSVRSGPKGNTEGRPRAAFAKSVVRAVSGPPDERSTTRSGSSART